MAHFAAELVAQFAAELVAQFAAESVVHFAAELVAHFAAESVAQFEWNIQTDRAERPEEATARPLRPLQRNEEYRPETDPERSEGECPKKLRDKS